MRRRRQQKRRPSGGPTRAVLAGGGLAAAATLLSGSVSDAAGTGTHVTVTTLGDTHSPAAAHVHHHRARTLADAIAYLDTRSGGGTITFASKLSGTVHVTSPLPAITRPIDLHGPGARRLTVENFVHHHPVFKVDTHNHAVTEFSGLTISGGQNGGIYARTPVIVRRATVSHNRRRLGGGGILSLSDLTVEHSSITHNKVTKYPAIGGGILVYGNGDLTIRESTVSGNTAPFGGGIATFGSGRTVIDRSTISGNAARHNVGGIDLEANSPHHGPRAFIENATIADNVAHGSDGGIYLGDKLKGGATTMLVVGSTISGNVAKHGMIGGIEDTYGEVRLNDSIVAANRDHPSGHDASPDIGIFGTGKGHQVKARFSLIGDGRDTIHRSLRTNRTDLVGKRRRRVNPRLKRLARHGGPTLTMPPRKGSPALRRGNAKAFKHAIRGLLFTIDQRGHRRVGRGGSGRTSDHTDIGAVEISKR